MSTDRPIVRPARADEVGILVSFQVAMAREIDDVSLDTATATAGMRAVFDDSAKGQYWVIAEADRCLGMLMTAPEWSDWRNGTVLWIKSVYVIPEARRRGLFRHLYRFLEQRVRQSPDLHGLRLYVDRHNTAAHKVYEALGMTRKHYELYEWMK